jgi:hypothetical protein
MRRSSVIHHHLDQEDLRYVVAAQSRHCDPLLNKKKTPIDTIERFLPPKKKKNADPLFKQHIDKEHPHLMLNGGTIFLSLHA